jgi:glycosyltransferase involved in cell wall biosynthesis
MKLLFAIGTPYLPSLGGAWKAIRAAAEQLAARGHEVRVLALARTRFDHDASADELLTLLEGSGIPVARDDTAYRFSLGGVEVATADGLFALHALLARECTERPPDAIVVSSEDPRQILLSIAAEHAADRVVYYALTTMMLPFGPHSSWANRFGKMLVAQSAAVLAASRYLADYIGEWGGRADVPVVYPPCLASDASCPLLGDFDRGVVGIINPSVLKGLPIFEGLARELPDVAFGAVPTWATSAPDLATLAALPNVRLIASSEAVDDVYRHIRIVLVPSLCAEAFGQVVVEALHRGIPVLASDAGGIPEALMGVMPPVPVRAIERYSLDRDNRTPIARKVPPQDLGPWKIALERFLTDRAEYERVSAAGREAGRRFVTERVHIEQLERIFDRVVHDQARSP